MAKQTGDIELVGTIITSNGAAATNPGQDLGLTSGSGNTTGAGGAITLQTGNGGAGSAFSAAGGTMNLLSGDGGPDARGGDINITAGESGAVGVFAKGGDINITAGNTNSVYGAGSFGGKIIITGGTSAVAQGGDVELRGGASFAANGQGGDVTMVGAAGNGTGSGGPVVLQGGIGGGTGGQGSSISLFAGAGGAGDGAGGFVTIQPGLKNGTGFEGRIRLMRSVAYQHDAVGTVTSATTLEPVDGTSHNFIFGAAATATVSLGTIRDLGNDESAEMYVEVINGGQGTLTWGASIQWAGGAAPTLTAAGTDLLKFWTRDNGTTWLGSVIGLNFS